MTKFVESGSLAISKSKIKARSRRSNEVIEAVRIDVTEYLNTSIWYASIDFMEDFPSIFMFLHTKCK